MSQTPILMSKNRDELCTVSSSGELGHHNNNKWNITTGLENEGYYCNPNLSSNNKLVSLGYLSVDTTDKEGQISTTARVSTSSQDVPPSLRSGCKTNLEHVRNLAAVAQTKLGFLSEEAVTGHFSNIIQGLKQGSKEYIYAGYVKFKTTGGGGALSNNNNNITLDLDSQHRDNNC